MADRLKGKIAVVVGAGQTPGETIGNGRATAILFAREGASVLLVDRDLASAEDTKRMIDDEGGIARCHRADITREEEAKSIADAAVDAFGRVDVLHNNVGIGAGDGGATSLDEETWDRIFDVNLKGMWLTCKHVLPIMRAQQSGAIINISSVASLASYPLVAYKVTKAAVNALTHQLATGNARFGIRANAILPGLMNTPMAIEGNLAARKSVTREQVIAERDRMVPLGRKMGSAWDVAYAALFLASDEAKFITGVLLPVDGGQSTQVG